MFTCFVCSKKLGSVKEILKHFKDFHKLKTMEFLSVVKNCLQHFSSKYSFSKHLNLHHEKDGNLNFYNEPKNTFETSLASLPNLSVSVDNNNEKLNNVNSNFDFSNEIHKSALTLTSELYAKKISHVRTLWIFNPK